MLVLRPIHLDDLDQLMALATQTGFGLTTLPRNSELLRERILESQSSFEHMSRRPRGEAYLFVLEDLRTGKIVGTSGVVSKVGGFEPFYAYKIEASLHESEMLSVRKEIRKLQLVMDHNGPSEIGSLFLSADYRKSQNGRLLSLGRFLFMAEHPHRFDEVVIAEMRGVIDDRGCSPFWDAVGKHFFDIDFPKADYLSMVNKKFIADLMPTHPIYIPLLPAEAQAVVAQVHRDTRPALRMLQDEGFAFNGMVDIFEAGPVVTCRRDAIRTVSQSRRAVISDIIDDPPPEEEFLVAVPRADFRVCKGWISPGLDGTLRISSRSALSLRVKVGDVIRYSSVRAPIKITKVASTADSALQEQVPPHHPKAEPTPGDLLELTGL